MSVQARSGADRRRMVRFAASAAFSLAAAASTPAQRSLHAFFGQMPGELFGWSARGAGDVDKDGRDDVIVGVPFRDGPAGPDAGRAIVYSGLDGRVIHAFTGSFAHEQFGFAVDAAGDVNRDGWDDVVVGAPGPAFNSTVPGRAVVYSGRDGSVLLPFSGVNVGDRFGFAVSGAGDVDRDLHPDVAVGAPGDDDDPQIPGAVLVFSGRTGDLLHAFTGLSPNERFGHAVAGVGDANGDGYADVVVGAPLADELSPLDAGASRLFSGDDGTVLKVLRGTMEGAELGWTVRAAGDVDRDGRDDYIVGARFEADRGRAHVMSGRTGSSIWLHTGPGRAMWFGNSVCGPGDVDGDGHADVLVGAPIAGVTPALPQVTPITGSLRMYSGRTGNLTYELVGGGNMVWLGFSVSAAGDVNDDGVPDLIVSSPMHNEGRGEVSVVSGRELLLTTSSYSISSSTGGTQVLSLDAKPAFAGAPYLLLGSITGTRPGLALGTLTLPLTPDPWMQTTLAFPNLPPLVNSLGVLDGLGRATAGFALPRLPALRGFTFHHAYVVFGLSPLRFLVASNAVPLTVN